jgi:hypothetical protein
MRVAFSQSGSGLEDEPSLQQLKFVHAPLLRAGSGRALALPQHRRPRPWPRPSGPGAHLFVLSTASHSCGTGAGRHWLPCRSDMGKKLSTARQQGGAGRGREHSRSRRLQHVCIPCQYCTCEMGIMGVHTPQMCAAQARGPGCAGCWTAFRTASTVHQAHPAMPPLPSLPWPLVQRSSNPQRLCLSPAR